MTSHRSGMVRARRAVATAGTAAPTVIVFLRFQRHFVAGLNLGAVK